MQISNPDGVSGVLNFVLPIEYFDTNSKTKNVMILYDDGSNTQSLLLDQEFPISINQKNYENSLFNNYYSFKVQDPLSLIVGENMFLYLLIYDKSNNCYYGDFDSLSSLDIILQKGDKSYSAKIKSREKIEGYSQCEYIYLVDFETTAEISGYYDVIIKDGSSEFKIESQIFIFHDEIDKTQSIIENINGASEPSVEAGHNMHLTFSINGENSIDLYDLIDELDLSLIDNEGNLVENNQENYIYEFIVNPDTNKIDINLKINTYGNYALQISKNGKIVTNDYSISVQPLECSMFGPEFNLLPIDNRNDYYYKEKITMEIKCKDIFGNYISQQGNEIFKVYAIRQTDNEIFEFDEKEFKEGKHYIVFSLDEVGNYILDVTLDGKKYGDSLNLQIKDFDTSKYNCMDKIQVNNLNDCDTSIYRVLLKEILGDDNICFSTTNKGALYKCDKSDTQCVKHTNQCECKGTSWQGLCYPDGSNPIELVNEELITCKNDLENVFSCGDGTCRYKQEECETFFECPIGYKSCVNKCILISQDCSVNINCNSDQVVCWDLSCASDYNSCPTRITCQKNQVVCPDGSCQLSGHCVQPPNRNCEDGEIQCSDFSCVSNIDECPINKVCEPGLSLCENKVCSQYCIVEENSKEEDGGNNTGAIVGGVIGGIGGVALIGLAFYFFYWRKRKKIPREVTKDFNTDEQNINRVKNNENVNIYNKKESSKRIIKNIGNKSDIVEINTGKENPIIENVDTIRVIKNE